MSMHWKLFQTRFAKRLFFYFLLSALLPVGILSLLTFFNYSNSQTEQMHDHMRFTAKTLGMHLYENLIHIKGELKQLGQDIASHKIVATADVLAKHHLASVFRRVVLVKDMQSQQALLGQPIHNFYISSSEKEQLHEKELLLTQGNGTSPQMILALNLPEYPYLYAELNSNFFQSIGDNLPNNFQLCISTLDNRPIFCPAQQNLLGVLKKHPELERLHTGQIKVTAGDEVYLAYFWSIFLQSAFAGDNWRISVVLPSEAVGNPHQSFSQTLYIILITLLIAAFFSSLHLHRQLYPLEALANAANNIFRGNLSARVNVASSDEFETVVNAFNTMADKMASQIDSLSNLAEVDRTLLSSSNSQFLVGKILVYIKKILHSHHVQLVIIASNDDSISTKSLLENNGAARYIHFLGSDFDKSAFTADNLYKIYGQRKLIPQSIRHTLREVEQSAIVFPIFIQDKLTAFVVASFLESKDANLLDVKHARDFTDRLAVVLTSASWEQRLYKKTHFDQVTRLPNRNLLLDRLDQALRRSKRYRSAVAVIFIDINRFKLINDTLSHAAGDVLLLEIAQRLAFCTSETDSIARFGGDKFVGILADIPDNENAMSSVIDTVEHLLAEIRKPFNLNNHEIAITASIGIAMFPTDTGSKDDLISFAEAAMYHAKSIGTNTYHFYSKEVNSRNISQLVLENDLRRALQNQELELYYQPQVSAVNGELLGVEALVRWNHKELGTLSPNTFMPLARNTGEIRALDLWVMRSACRQIREWLDNDIVVKRIAINLSADQFQKADILVSLDEYLDEYAIAPNLLELEITEDTLMKDLNTTTELLHALNNRGVKLAIDDFGTGYSSLNYLAKFPLQYLKIDQSFISELLNDQNMAAIVSATIALAHSLKLKVIAEGVENQRQLKFLTDIDCDIIQGFLISKPLSALEFEAWYGKHKATNSSVIKQGR